MIGWYVHHHGFGHVARFLAVQPHLRTPVVAFSSLTRPPGLDPSVEWRELPSDADAVEAADGTVLDPRSADPTARGALHWAPHDHPGHRARLATIARVAAERHLGAFVVDVSAEVVALARLLGLRTVAVTQPGARTDAPHALAYRLADRIVAPWPHGAVPTPGLTAHADRVVWTGGISRFDARTRENAREPRAVLLLGHILDPAVHTELTTRLSAGGWDVRSIGHDDHARVDDPWPLLCRSTVVVSAAGQNSVADLAASGARAVVIAQDRPFDEQRATADALERSGLARTADSADSAAELASVIERAGDDDPDWTRWQVSGAATRMAAAIEGMLP
ncbi:glycosyltransferase [Microbacterium sp. Kw_RZR3]|uniref:glycosyltransferase n=1 Tax=Microbacterium sp. Kw_RZR3 TaxID=3032903 RepID=UPI0023DBBEE0|nr:glycosyltransferase [Microbacterium sp. Kw_RZR3]MDF2046615.1 glycosyltransferase [Microbacterium sp. Kw_RZR3]